jgi:hypothetical protein
MTVWGPRFLSRLHEWWHAEFEDTSVCFFEYGGSVIIETFAGYPIGNFHMTDIGSIQIILHSEYPERQQLLLFLLRTLSAFLQTANIHYTRNIAPE